MMTTDVKPKQNTGLLLVLVVSVLVVLSFLFVRAFSEPRIVRLIKEGRAKQLSDLIAKNPTLVNKQIGALYPIHYASSALNAGETVSVLLAAGADPNARSEVNNMTPLHYSALANTKDAARSLIDSGADVNAVTTHGVTPMHLAVQEDSRSVIIVLLSHGARVDVRDNSRRKYTPLHYAVRYAKPETLLLLLESGADPNMKSAEGTPLHVAAAYGKSNMIKPLVSAGADPNSKAEGGMTPLHVASFNSKVEAADQLLSVKADVNAKNNNDLTPLHIAASDGNYEIVKLLLQNGADVRAIAKGGATPMAMAKNDQIRDLISAYQK